MTTLVQAETELDCRRVDVAMQLFDRAEQEGADPDACAAGRWTGHMLRGHFASAWAESDGIEARGRPDPNRFWNGQSLRGQRVMLRCLHGLGDTLQFLRFVPQIRKCAAHLTLETQPLLKTLLLAANQELPFADQILTWGEREPAWDVQIEINELPRILRITQSDLLPHWPYLQLRNTCVHPNETLRVGLVWAAGDFNPARSIPIEFLKPLLQLENIHWHTLQAGMRHADANGYCDSITKICGIETPALDTARAMLNLHLIVTVDSMPAHLAGALARPVWTLLPHYSDWRWQLDRLDSPWYPTMRLFRQPACEDWQSVVAQVRDELTAFAADPSALQANCT